MSPSVLWTILQKRTCLLLLVMAGWTTTATAQQDHINFTALTSRNGLSSNSVNAILKDRYGLMWFATEDGLDKFDGVHFTIYRHKPKDPSSLQANEILSLHEDKSGNLWVGTSGGSLSLYDRKKDAFVHFPAGNGANAIANNVVENVCSDYQGRLWIAHYSGVNILDPATKRISTLSAVSGRPNLQIAQPSLCLLEDRQHRMWIGTTEGLYQYNPATRSLTRFLHDSQNPSSLAGNIVNTLAEDKAGNVWVGTTEGLCMMKPGQNSFVAYLKNGLGRGLASNFLNSIAVDGDDLWLGTDEGLSIFHIPTGEARSFRSNERDMHSLTAKSVHCIYIDRQGIYWLGTIRGGVNKYDKNLNLFDLERSNAFDEKGLPAPIVTAFAQDGAGNLYVGTENGGLNLFDRSTKLFRHFPIQSGRIGASKGLVILDVAKSRNNNLLIGTFSDGLFRWEPGSGAYRQLLRGTNKGDLNSNEIFCMTEDRKGNCWVGTNGGGINVLNPNLEVTVRYTPNPQLSNDVLLPINGYIRDIMEDGEGRFWIATHGGGIAVLNPATGRFTIYTTANSGLPNDKVLSLVEDSQGNIWAGTLGGGLGRFDKKTDRFVSLSEKDGLQNNVVYAIVDDRKGSIWVSTNQGISSIDLRTRKVNNYNSHNGVQYNNFVRGAGYRTSDGELFFGGLEGFNHFNPGALKKNSNVPTVLMTDLRISNQSVSASEDGPIQENISIAKEINLDYKQNFALSYVGLNYTSPEQNQYAYKLEGFEKDWNEVGNVTSAAYTNLDPGTYVFRVRASNNDGVWNEKGTAIRIVVHPPFWRTTFAYLFYVLAITGLAFFLRHRSLEKLRRKFALAQERMKAEQDRKEAERVHELDRLKIKFLTNLSHDFRTPISLILGPVDTLLAQEKNNATAGSLHMIKRNARRLLNLVNQLLDFRKMEEHELRLAPTEGEVVSFVREVSDSFRDFSERKNIAFMFESRLQSLHTVFDHDKVERILFNVLSNAFKFTLAGGEVHLVLSKDEKASDTAVTWVTITVSDTGIGIPADKKGKIFDRFFQSPTTEAILSQGTGIGLSITKEFVRMHGGTIDVESEVGKGTVFTIALPFVPLPVPAAVPVPAVEAPNELLETVQEEETAEELVDAVATKDGDKLPTVLIVEDNEDFRFYLKDNLRLHYKVLEAANGKEGWQKALANHPQLIVSDVNMPLMDGIAFSRKIKSDKRTSHIPLILLTALTGDEDQMKGLETGANDYITKPFNFELLNAKIKNLLVLNNTLKSTYTKQIKVLTPEVQLESEDEKLLATIMLYLEENLTNPQLSVEELSRHVGMSRSSLYSKLLELTGQTPVEYIRSVKLEKAAVLLEKSDLNIAQVAYSVGFSTPNYFAKSFKAKFNLLPSEYANKARSEREKKEAQ